MRAHGWALIALASITVGATWIASACSLMAPGDDAFLSGGAPGLGLGADCSEGPQCASKRCSGSTGGPECSELGICVECTDDPNCQSNQRCDNCACVPRLPAGQPCEGNSDCLSASADDQAGCTLDGGIDLGDCARPSAICVACLKDDRCGSGRCEDCECQAQLPEGSACDEKEDCFPELKCELGQCAP
jgi:hypothetical protein